MDIDLLFTKEGEAGLIFRENLVQKAAGVVFDTQAGILTLEYVDMDYLEMNIPVESDFHGVLEYCSQVHIGAVKEGNISQAYQIPFMFLDDPYRGEALKAMKQTGNALVDFDHFVRRCTTGQPVHRDDLGNEDTMGCVLGDSSPGTLQFAPHLARRHAMEVAPKAAPTNIPRGPGLGGGGGGTAQRGTQIPPRKSGDTGSDKD